MATANPAPQMTHPSQRNGPGSNKAGKGHTRCRTIAPTIVSASRTGGHGTRLGRSAPLGVGVSLMESILKEVNREVPRRALSQVLWLAGRRWLRLGMGTTLSNGGRNACPRSESQPMSQPASPTGAKSAVTNLVDRIRRLVVVEPGEWPALLWSFAFFYCVLCAYYILRPVRDAMGVTVGPDYQKWLFSIVFLVMLAAVPIFGWVVSTFAKRQVLPIVYLFFIANLLVFWALIRTRDDSPNIAGAFFIWVSIFNLFVVSLFWSFLADHYTSDQAKRLYGFITAGGSLGVLTGSSLTNGLVHVVGVPNLLLISALILTAALGCALVLRTILSSAGDADRPAHAGVRDILSGALHSWNDPYLFRIALWVLLANLVGTYFYIEEQRIVRAAPDPQGRPGRFFLQPRPHRQRVATRLAILLDGLFAAPFRHWSVRRRASGFGRRWPLRLVGSADLDGDLVRHDRRAGNGVRPLQSGDARAVDGGRARGQIQNAELYRHRGLSRRRRGQCLGRQRPDPGPETADVGCGAVDVAVRGRLAGADLPAQPRPRKTRRRRSTGALNCIVVLHGKLSARPPRAS